MHKKKKKTHNTKSSYYKKSMEAVHSIVRTGLTGLGLGLIYGTVRTSVDSIKKASENSKEISRFNRLYPSLRHHTDLLALLHELHTYQPYADVRVLLRACEAFMREYVRFEQSEHVSNTQLLLFPKRVHDLGQKVKTACQDLVSDIVSTKVDSAAEVGEHTQAVEKVVDDLLFNVLMEVDTRMEIPEVD